MSDNLPFDGESVMSDAPFVCRSCDGQYLNPRMDRLRACFPTGVIYVTVLRDPIEMVLSSVSYVELQHDWEKTGMYDMQKNFVDVELTPSGTALRLVNGTTEVLSYGIAMRSCRHNRAKLTYCASCSIARFRSDQVALLPRSDLGGPLWQGRCPLGGRAARKLFRPVA